MLFTDHCNAGKGSISCKLDPTFAPYSQVSIETFSLRFPTDVYENWSFLCSLFSQLFKHKWLAELRFLYFGHTRHRCWFHVCEFALPWLIRGLLMSETQSNGTHFTQFLPSLCERVGTMLNCSNGETYPPPNLICSKREDRLSCQGYRHNFFLILRNEG